MIRHLHRLRRGRSDATRHLEVLPNVVGTGIGFRFSDGVMTRQPAILAFVSKKQRIDDLPQDARVPRTIVNRGFELPVDVIEIERPVRQVSGPPFFCLDDGANQGTVTALARIKGQGSGYAMSCAHCVEGADANLTTPCPMSLWDQPSAGWALAGTYSPPLYAFNGGNGMPGDYGFTDWALFSVSDPGTAQRALNNNPLVSASPQVGTNVSGNAAGGRIPSGTISAVEVSVYGWRADVLIMQPGAPTVAGDSGLLWRDQYGRAVAIHAALSSNFSLGMSARRVINSCAQAGIVLVAP